MTYRIKKLFIYLKAGLAMLTITEWDDSYSGLSNSTGNIPKRGPCFNILPKRNTNVIGRHSIHYAIYLSKELQDKELVLVFITFYIPLSGLLILINLAFVITFLTNFHTTNSDANPILSLSPVGLLNVALFTYPSNFQSVSSIPVSEFYISYLATSQKLQAKIAQ